MAAARAALIVGLLVAGLGIGRFAYFTHWFDTRELVHVPAPPGVEVPFEEAVWVPNADLEAQARAGEAAAWRLVIFGGTASAAGAAALKLIQRRTNRP